MRVLLLTNYFPPEVGSGPHIPYELGAWLVQAGHSVQVVTGFPRYNMAELPPQYLRRMLFRESLGGMDVLRVATPNFYGRAWISRGLVQLLSPPLLGIRSLFVERPDVVFTISPPLLLAVAARWLSKRFRVSSVVYVMDLFPQTVVDLGLLKNRCLLRFFEKLERGVYRKSSALLVLSDGHRQYVMERGADPERVFVVPTWAEVETFRPGERRNAFRLANRLEDEFVVLFAGTMGFCQGLEIVVEAAWQLADEPGLTFLMVGDGAQRQKLEEQAHGLSSMRFLPMQPKHVYPQVLAACDVALVTLRPEVTTPTVPSKIMTIMAAGRPLVACLPREAGRDAAHWISEAQCGLVVPAGDASALAAAVLKLKHDRLASQVMGDNGRRYAEKHFTTATSVGMIEPVLEFLTRRPVRASPPGGHGTGAGV